MASIINKIFGNDKDEKSSSHTTSSITSHSGPTSTTVCTDAKGHGGTAHTAVSDDIRVKSTVTSDTQTKVSMENAAKINDLMTKLSTTHSQIDAYSKKRTDQIDEAVGASLKKVVAETQAQQEQLLHDANSRTKALEEEYKLKLQTCVEELHVQKAQTLATLEKELKERQERILTRARAEIDQLNQHANEAKINVMKDAQTKINTKVEDITDQVQALGADDAARRLQSTTTTVITSQTKATGETQAVIGAAVVVPDEKTTTHVTETSSTHSTTQN
ncbi:unnamed protein product [Didymodactylos carnosus]|uniref:Uncharacterized protein n=1 Tax=Didymodactylos carnosus TaxID=1234261 RepID=A0A814CQ13_9BILA|nr:unnamed protein product [Didymodactylos carnosus]CAF1062504.1 unnamed protein product [Didymodactylos carnosus]CAF3719535.1 unnamed protein product [Didymodactylos carnosus]CAF3827943.1 unnamed protein product [Didymodactylos carnosus]